MSRAVATLFGIFTPLLLIVDRLRRRRRRRREQWMRFSVALAAIGISGARATSVTPPSFSELVGEAQTIARGTVAAVESRWVDAPDGRIIKTFVTFTVEKRIKGNPPDSLTLEFLGGTVGTESLKVDGMPHFQIGEREILFVRDNGVQFCPLVRLMHGRYRVRADQATGRRYVARDDDTPMASVNDVELPADTHGVAKAFRSAATAMAPDDFEARISEEAFRHAR